MEECTSCACSPAEILLFPCSGGSNVGQIANAAAVKLNRDQVGKMFCLAGIGGHIESMLNSAKGAKRLVALDGCAVACARHTLEHAGFVVTDQVIVTELGIEKRYDLDPPPEAVARVAEEARKSLAVPR
ncbi:MAG: putative zinc-binding protein [Moorellales bacterium]